MTTFLAPTRSRRREIAAITRERAAALFPSAPGKPPEPDPKSAPPEPVAESTSARRRLWLLALLERLPTAVQVRCGLELRAVVALVVLGVVAVGFAAHHFWTGRPERVEVPAAVASPSPRTSAAGEPRRVVVDIAGKVRDPGVRRLPSGSRVADALRAAGGALPGTDTSTLNLARVLGDGEQVLVGAPGPGPGPGSAPGPGPGPGTAPVSLNAATADQLDALPGVGPVLARHILDFRTEHGGFTSVDQLREVNGIGARRFDDLQALVRL